jgi:hypothetical protein
MQDFRTRRAEAIKACGTAGSGSSTSCLVEANVPSDAVQSLSCPLKLVSAGAWR